MADCTYQVMASNYPEDSGWFFSSKNKAEEFLEMLIEHESDGGPVKPGDTLGYEVVEHELDSPPDWITGEK